MCRKVNGVRGGTKFSNSSFAEGSVVLIIQIPLCFISSPVIALVWSFMRHSKIQRQFSLADWFNEVIEEVTFAFFFRVRQVPVMLADWKKASPELWDHSRFTCLQLQCLLSAEEAASLIRLGLSIQVFIRFRNLRCLWILSGLDWEPQLWYPSSLILVQRNLFPSENSRGCVVDSDTYTRQRQRLCAVFFGNLCGTASAQNGILCDQLR